MRIRQNAREDMQVLIVPLWNWNSFDLFAFETMACSNRTFMELKYEYKDGDINPLPCSNRTFMELKCIFKSIASEQFTVLIVPLWNWNKSTVVDDSSIITSSNRTFMELK